MILESSLFQNLFFSNTTLRIGLIVYQSKLSTKLREFILTNNPISNKFPNYAEGHFVTGKNDKLT